MNPAIVTISAKYQVVIPQEIRETMQLKPGTKVMMIPSGNRSSSFFNKTRGQNGVS
ncbi:MAG: AbrB/MazE/SpoVT family DNA-binding domain-containing protein [Cyanophyceae cyanobacterium]